MKEGRRKNILRIYLTLLRPSEQNNLTNQWVSDAELNLREVIILHFIVFLTHQNTNELNQVMTREYISTDRTTRAKTKLKLKCANYVYSPK